MSKPTEIFGNDLAKIVNVSFDAAACLDIANMAARRAATNENRTNGMSWWQAHKAAKSVKATAGQQALVTDLLMRGATTEQAVAAVLEAA